MNNITRRRFLVYSGAAGVAALAGASLITWDDMEARAIESPLPAGTRILVLVTLYGGNDGLGTVIPFADPVYQQARGDFAYGEGDVLPLGESLGLNPALTGMSKLWAGQNLAVVRGVGYPKPDRSHFKSMDIWQTASPDAPITTGWIGRWLDSGTRDPLRAVNIGTVLPPLAVGASTAAAALSLGGGRVRHELDAAVSGLGIVDPTDTPAEIAVAGSYCDRQLVSATFAPILGNGAAVEADSDQEAGGASAGGASGLAGQLQMVARCIKAGVPTTVYTVSLGGFDTHADEKGTQEALLRSFDGAVSSFVQEMAGTPNGQGVVVMSYSEFGRRVQANASDGTDHGTAGPVLLAGVPVQGGFYGEQPSLTDLDNGDLKANIDFRRIYGEMLSGVLNADPAQVLGTTPEPLGLLRAT